MSIICFLEAEEAESKNFLDILTVPGCVLMLIYCTSLKASASARYTEISNWMILNVSLYRAIISSYKYSLKICNNCASCVDGRARRRWIFVS